MPIRALRRQNCGGQFGQTDEVGGVPSSIRLHYLASAGVGAKSARQFPTLFPLSNFDVA
jgi:hypothetical protein